MKFGDYPKVGSLQDLAAFRAHLRMLECAMPCDDTVVHGPGAPLGDPIEVMGRSVGNRFAVQPMEGWDALEDGRPSERTKRRWRHFGLSGAKLVWGGEAVAVRPDGRANPNQLYFADHTHADIRELREVLVAAHREVAGDDDLLVGLQLTHSGRFCRPNAKGRLEPLILYRHPLLDRKAGASSEAHIMTDDEIDRLIGDFVAAAKRAYDCGFHFVDIKHCHGYLGHEFLSAVDRPGRYGGSFENRTRFLRDIVSGVRSVVPDLGIAVRVSAFDLIPFEPDPVHSSGTTLGPGVPQSNGGLPYRHAFGVNANEPDQFDLTEPKAFVRLLWELGIRLVNVTGGSPYYNPHVQRPALYPPSDGYLPPEDPLVGVMRHIEVARQLKACCPEMTVVGTGYTYLQEYLPNVAQAVVRQGWADFVGLGRMLLSYPELPRDILAGKKPQKKLLCRSFSDCTTAPRAGLPSGCYPLDPQYKKSPEFGALTRVKKAAKLS